MTNIFINSFLFLIILQEDNGPNWTCSCGAPRVHKKTKYGTNMVIVTKFSIIDSVDLYQ